MGALVSELTLNLLATKLQEILAPSLFAMLTVYFTFELLKAKQAKGARNFIARKFSAEPVEFITPALGELYVKEQELRRFKQAFKFSAPGYERGVEVANWMMKNDIPARDVRAAGGNFDIENVKLKERDFTMRRRFVGAIGAILIAISAAFLSVIPVQGVVASFPDSPYFVIGEDYASLSVFNMDKLTSQKCADEDFVKMQSDSHGFSLDKVRLICQSLGQQNGKQWVINELYSQRSSAFFLSLIFAIPLYEVIRTVVALDAAKRIRKSLESTH